jgi:NSS family neurotransmitter:Na+ symporter
MSLFKSHSRPQWSSNFVYILAAIGSAAGLGNLWRFSMLAYEHGGAAFILALLVSNVLMVFPLVMMETIVGQKSQLGGPSAFEKLKPKTSWIQWLPVFGLIVLMLYYAPILAWGIKYLVTNSII